jgi:imidazole glycerol-phosphate synthase subunit HisH
VGKKVTIVDYGVGNLSSLSGTLEKLNCSVSVTKNAKDLKNSDLIILPGVGAFPHAMDKLKENNLVKTIKKLSINGKYILGICLGMHLLTECSNEIKYTKGLKILPGKIISFKNNKHNIGWSSIKLLEKKSYFYPLNNKFFYFQHRYLYLGPSKYKVSTSKDVTSIIKYKNTFGVQFHPEKSQLAGIEFLKILLEKTK